MADRREAILQELWAACVCGDARYLENLIGRGLTAADARADDNRALRVACSYDNLEVVDRLLSLGLTADDARADDNYALREACANGYRAVICALAAAGVIEPTGELQVVALEQIIRAPTMSRLDEPEASRRAETRRAAARVAAEWQGHAEALAQLGDEAAVAWEELYAEATLTGYGALRFAD
jgi:ankyrin repeat protein